MNADQETNHINLQQRIGIFHSNNDNEDRFPFVAQLPLL